MWKRNVFRLLLSGALWDPTPDPPRVFVSFGSFSVGASGPEGTELWRMTASHVGRAALSASANAASPLVHHYCQVRQGWAGLNLSLVKAIGT